MKTVEIEGKEYKVPDKANWVAKDSDGRWYWYECEPRVTTGEWESDGSVSLIVDSDDGWLDTKRRI